MIIFTGFPDCSHAYIEVDRKGRPLRPLDIIGKVEDYAKENKNFTTVSVVALDAVSRLIRRGDLVSDSVSVLYVFRDHKSRTLHFDAKGEFIEPWPEEGLDSLYETSFYLRYGDGE